MRIPFIAMILVGLAAAAYAIASQGQPLSPGDNGFVIGKPPTSHALELAFSEEFDGDTIDQQRWGFVFADPSTEPYPVTKRTLYTNNERQIYADPSYLNLGIDPFQLRNGILTITAQPLSSDAQRAIMAELSGMPDARDNTALQQIAYSSGLISTRGKWTQRHGYFEAKMRWTGGRGLWPAFWMLREDSQWPPEIDIVEALGHDPATVYSSTHSAVKPLDTTRTIKTSFNPADFHRYGALWLPDRIDYYIDGKKTASIPSSPDMDRPMYLLLNLAVGGNWPGFPDASTPMPARLDIDYVRGWKLITTQKLR